MDNGQCELLLLGIENRTDHNGVGFVCGIGVTIVKQNHDFYRLLQYHTYHHHHAWLTFTATRYLPPYTPHVGPLDPVTFKEATLFTCIRVH